jgi:hypothetical protein
MPQRGQYEQEINAFYMQKIGLGTALRNRSAPEREVAEFLKSRSPSPRPSAGVEDMAKRVFGMLAARRRGSAP